VTERLSDVVARIRSVRQLSSVIGAMRGIAAARAREARERIEGIRDYARTVGAAIGQALAFVDGRASGGPREGRDGRLVIALCAEQGFAGTFNRRVLDVAERLLKSAGSHPAELLLLGARGLMAAEERGLRVGWSAAMAAHVDEVAALADRVTEQLYARLESGRATRVTVAHAAPAPSAEIRVVERPLAPFDFARFPRLRNPAPPLISLPPGALLAELAEEYVFAELCEALTQSLAAENEARMRAMTAAKTNVSAMLDELVARSRQLRQEEITNEIIELGGRKGRGSARNAAVPPASRSAPIDRA
jgi:F-type H+-transporting ATPase subunit gamma